MIMIANMKTAAIVDVTRSTAVKALRLALINLVSVGWGSGRLVVSRSAVCACDSLDRHGSRGGIELLERVAAALAARIEPIRPGFRHALQKILEFGANLGLQRFEVNPGRCHGLFGGLVGLLHLL